MLLALTVLAAVGYLAGGASTAYYYYYTTTSSTTGTTSTSTSTSTTTTTTGTTSTTTGTTTSTTTTTITTTKHKRRPPKCHVPRVVNMKRGAATKRIVRAHCRVGNVRKKWSTTFTKNRVISQRPRGGTILKKGGRVNLVVSIAKCHNDHDHDRDDLCPPAGVEVGRP